MKKGSIIIPITLIVLGFSLLLWFGVGQVVSQIKLFGYYSFKIVFDISLIGTIGVVPLIVGIILLFNW